MGPDKIRSGQERVRTGQDQDRTGSDSVRTGEDRERTGSVQDLVGTRTGSGQDLSTFAKYSFKLAIDGFPLWRVYVLIRKS